MSLLGGQSSSSTPEAHGLPSFQDMYSGTDSISRISQLHQSRKMFLAQSAATPSMDMYSVDYDVDNAVDQLIAQQFASISLPTHVTTTNAVLSATAANTIEVDNSSELSIRSHSIHNDFSVATVENQKL